MRDTPPQPQCTPSPPLSAPCCRQVSARGFHGSLCCVWRHPLAEQASPSGVLRSLRYAQKKKSLSLFLSVSGQHPKMFKDVCAHATWHSPIYYPPSLPLSLHTTPTVWRVQCLLQRTEQPSLALLHLLFYYFYYFYYFLLVHKQHCCARAFWRVKLCCCAAAAHSQTAAHTHTHIHTGAEIERQRKHMHSTQATTNCTHSRFGSLAAPASLTLFLSAGTSRRCCRVQSNLYCSDV